MAAHRVGAALVLRRRQEAVVLEQLFPTSNEVKLYGHTTVISMARR